MLVELVAPNHTRDLVARASTAVDKASQGDFRALGGFLTEAAVVVASLGEGSAARGAAGATEAAAARSASLEAATARTASTEAVVGSSSVEANAVRSTAGESSAVRSGAETAEAGGARRGGVESPSGAGGPGAGGGGRPPGGGGGGPEGPGGPPSGTGEGGPPDAPALGREAADDLIHTYAGRNAELRDYLLDRATAAHDAGETVTSGQLQAWAADFENAEPTLIQAAPPGAATLPEVPPPPPPPPPPSGPGETRPPAIRLRRGRRTTGATARRCPGSGGTPPRVRHGRSSGAKPTWHRSSIGSSTTRVEG